MNLLFALAAATAGAACETPIDSNRLVADLELADAAFSRQDLEAFQASTDSVRAEIGCVGESLPRPVIAALHRTFGLRAYVDRDGTLAVQAFAASRAIEPDFSFPTTEVPEGHPLRADFAAMDPASSPLTPVPAAKGGHVEIDGIEAEKRPTDRPILFQRFERGGAVADTAWVPPGAPLPAYDVAHPLTPAAVGLAIGSGTLAVASGSLLVAARASLSSWEGLDTSTAQGQAGLAPGRSRTNALIAASAGSAGAALATGLAAVVVQVF